MQRIPTIVAFASLLGVAGCYEGISGADGNGDGADAGDGADGGTDGMDPDEQCLANPDPGPYLIRRLTNREYVNTLRDALGVDVSDLAAALPPDQADEGFLNHASTQITSFDHVDAYANIADQVAVRVGDMAAFIGQHTACTDFTPACQDPYIDSLGRALYRRPLTDDDRLALQPLFATAAADGDGFEEAARRVLLAMLQSPRFLYRVERQQAEDGETFRALDDYEIAARLSYALLGSTPDEGLYAAAAAGELTTDDGVRTQVDRLLATDAARENSKSFIRGWMDLERLVRVVSALNTDMEAEAEAFFDDVVWETEAPLSTLFTAEYTLASSALADHYGLDAPDGDGRYDLGADPNRRGLLTQASFLTSGEASGSLVLRGKFLLENILCSEIPPPPPGVNNASPELEPGKSQRWYSEQRSTTMPCGGCHSFMDPLAYSMTIYDPLGAVMDVDAGGNELLTDGVLQTPDDPAGRPFNDIEEFIDVLVADSRFQQCLARKPLQFLIGRSYDHETDGCTVDALVAGGDLTYQQAVHAVAQHTVFRTIRTE